jgi:hypothetical protein
MAPSGVRSSCEIIAMNSSFARFDDSASSRADASTRSSSSGPQARPALGVHARGQLARRDGLEQVFVRVRLTDPGASRPSPRAVVITMTGHARVRGRRATHGRDLAHRHVG